MERSTVLRLSNLIGGVGKVRSLIPERTTPHGRIITLKVVGDRAAKRINASQLREALDLRSTLFTISLDNGTFEINGRGYRQRDLKGQLNRSTDAAR